MPSTRQRTPDSWEKQGSPVPSSCTEQRCSFDKALSSTRISRAWTVKCKHTQNSQIDQRVFFCRSSANCSSFCSVYWSNRFIFRIVSTGRIVPDAHGEARVEGNHHLVVFSLLLKLNGEYSPRRPQPEFMWKEKVSVFCVTVRSAAFVIRMRWSRRLALQNIRFSFKKKRNYLIPIFFL